MSDLKMHRTRRNIIMIFGRATQTLKVTTLLLHSSRQQVNVWGCPLSTRFLLDLRP
jgi:hypothetical protein